MSGKNHKPLFPCQLCWDNRCHCAEQLRVWGNYLICESCYVQNVVEDENMKWKDLPAFVPEHVREIERLRCELADISNQRDLYKHDLAETKGKPLDQWTEAEKQLMADALNAC